MGIIRRIKDNYRRKYIIKPDQRAMLKILEKNINKKLQDYMTYYSKYLSSNPRVNPTAQFAMEDAAKELNDAIRSYNNYRIKYGLSPVNFQRKIKHDKF